MRQTIKRFGLALLMLVSVFALTACGGTQNQVDESVDAEIVTSLESTVDGLATSLSSLSDEEIASYQETGDAFTVSAMEAWTTSAEELGAYQEVLNTEVTMDEDMYIVTSDVKYEKGDATWTMNVDAAGTPTYMTIEVNYSMGALMERAALNTIMGVCIVFCMLLLLSFIISLFKYIGKIGNKEVKAEAPAPAPVVAAPVVEENLVDDGELVAVITAAIAASEQTSTDGFVVRSIKRKNNNQWLRA